MRADIAYAVKDLPRGVSKLTFKHLNKAKHLLRYLHGARDYCVELKPTLGKTRETNLLCVVLA